MLPRMDNPRHLAFAEILAIELAKHETPQFARAYETMLGQDACADEVRLPWQTRPKDRQVGCDATSISDAIREKILMADLL